jgi:hypothetical protein
MPAIGVVTLNIASGISVSGGAVLTHGFSVLSSGASIFPTYGAPLYVGTSGQIVTRSGSWGSGGLISGNLFQVLGVSVGNLTAFWSVYPMASSGPANPLLY